MKEKCSHNLFLLLALFSGCNERNGKDKDLHTSSRYILVAKIARITDKKEKGKEHKEYYVETSQSDETAIPILIGAIKENYETLDYMFKWIQDFWERDLKCFTVRFDNRDIKVHFPKPKLIGDGKLFLNLLNVKQAFCYLCYITKDDAQDVDKACEHQLDRNLEEMIIMLEDLLKKWNEAKRTKKTRKEFLSYFSAAERKFITGLPTIRLDGFDWHNIPTMHFKIHLFDFLKKLNYQMNSRKYTRSKKSVAELERDQPKKKQKKVKKIVEVHCQNPKCKKEFEGFSKLMTHVTGKRNKTLRCIKYYGEHNLLDKLCSDAKNEKTFHRRTKRGSIWKKHLVSATNEFSRNMYKTFHIRVNQRKRGGKSGDVENGSTTTTVLARKNRKLFLDMFHTINDKERKDLDKLFDQALVIISVTNRIGKINVNEFNKFVLQSYRHWTTAFGKFHHIKSSLHWTLSHIGSLIARNDSYTLAEVSENSIEKIIKPYRQIRYKKM